MRKILIILIFLAAIMQLYCQPLQKGNFSAGLSGGLGVYSAVANDTMSDEGGLINAGCLTVPVHFAYYFSDYSAFGVVLERNRFFTGDDSVRMYGRSAGFGLYLEGQLLNKKDDNLVADLQLGRTSIYIGEQKTMNKISGSGSFFQFGLSYRHFYSNVLGIFFRAAISNYKYSELTNERDQIITVSDGSEPFYINFTGVHIGAGVCMKF